MLFAPVPLRSASDQHAASSRIATGLAGPYQEEGLLRWICLKSRRDMGDETDDEAQQEEDAATSPEQLATPGDQPPPTALNHENSG